MLVKPEIQMRNILTMVGADPDTVGKMDTVDLDTHVRHEVIRWRHRRGWTQPEFAEHLRPCLPEARRTWAVQPNISRFESGAAADLTTIFAMARALGVPFMSLLGPLPQDRTRIESALDDPRVRAFVEAVEAGAPSEVVNATVSMLRQLAGLPAFVQRHGPTTSARG